MTLLDAADKVPIHNFERQGNLGPVSLRKRILESMRLQPRRAWTQVDKHRAKDGGAS
jgi:hypothetical protein